MLSDGEVQCLHVCLPLLATDLLRLPFHFVIEILFDGLQLLPEKDLDSLVLPHLLLTLLRLVQIIV